MAVTDAYATAAQYRATILHTDTGDDTQILNDLTAMSRFIEALCNRFFTKDAAPVARVYYANPNSALGNPEAENPFAVQPRLNRRLYVDDISSTTGLVIKLDNNRDGDFTDSTTITLATTDYQLEPLNAALGPEVNPWTAIYLPTWSTQLGFPPGMAIQVTAAWGWPAVPQAIINACCALTAIWRLETPRALGHQTDIGSIQLVSPDARRIVKDIVHAYGQVTF